MLLLFFPYLNEGLFIEFPPPANGEYDLIIKCAVFIFHGMPSIHHVSDQMSLTNEIGVSY